MTAHFYTADSNERNNAIQNLRFSDEGIACYVFSTQVPGSAPLFRAWHPTTGAHLYTMDVAERDRATTTLGYVAEGITGYIYGGHQSGAIPLYRAYRPTTIFQQPASDDHFYTADQAEHNRAVQQLGYNDEGVTGYVLAGATSGTVPLYRMYGPVSAAPAQLTVNGPIDPGPDEPCNVVLNPQSPNGLLTADYHWPPAEYLDNPQGPEESDGRVNAFVRTHAQMRDARKILDAAVKAHLGIPNVIDFLLGKITIPSDPKSAPILAQLAVTGRAAFESFAEWHPQDGDLVQYVRQTNPGQNFDSRALQNAATQVLDVAYTTLSAIRGNDASWREYRTRLGWIAVSGEDDLPHRPVNIYTAPYPQYDVEVPGPVSITTRYMVASAATSLRLPAGTPVATPAAPRSIPADGHPNIPPQNKIMIYIHGGGSRLEEAVSLADKLIEAGARRGIAYTIISLDMPNSGLSTPFDHTLVANAGPGGGLGSYHPPQGDPHKPIPNPPLTYGYPIFDTEEQYVLNFIDAIDHQIGNVKNRIVACMGGSLGGNISFRLARRANQYPYFRNIISWSVTCMQGAQDPNIVGHIGGLIASYNENEQNTSRHNFFDNLYNHPLVPIALPPQPQLWYRDGWEPCKSSHIQRSKFDRYEYYTPQFRRWTQRLNYEMTIFSFQEGDLYAPNKAEGPPRYLTVNARLLLAAGDKDEHDPFYTLYGSTVAVARKMANTSGTTLFLKNTGHSIHDERPGFFAEQIVQFLGK